MHRVQVQFTEPQLAALKRLSAEQGRSVSDLVREAVDRLVAERPDRDAELRRRALALVGKFDSGRTDVSRHHDEHLSEAFRQ